MDIMSKESPSETTINSGDLASLRIYHAKLKKALEVDQFTVQISGLGFQGVITLRNKKLIQWAMRKERDEVAQQIEDLAKNMSQP